MKFWDLQEINEQINADTTYTCDMALYGREDFWELVKGKGDCEDYALTKRKHLLDIGWPLEALRIACCWTEKGEYHGVLIATFEDKDYVLGNDSPYVTLWHDTPYKWDRIEVIGQYMWEEILV